MFYNEVINMEEEELNKEYKKHIEHKDKLFKDKVKVKNFPNCVTIDKEFGKFYRPD